MTLRHGRYPGGAIVALASLAGLVGLSCTRSPAAQVKNDMATMVKEGGPERMIDRGKAFAAIGDTTRAEQYFAAALSAGGDERVVIPYLLTVCAQDGRYRVAIQYAETYLKSHPNDLRVRFVLGALYSAVGEAAPAHEALRTVVAARPEDADAHFAFGVLLRDNEHDYAGADQQFREYLRLEPRGAHAEEAEASLLKSVQ